MVNSAAALHAFLIHCQELRDKMKLEFLGSGERVGAARKVGKESIPVSELGGVISKTNRRTHRVGVCSDRCCHCLGDSVLETGCLCAVERKFRSQIVL
jgi:hypothetical protein